VKAIAIQYSRVKTCFHGTSRLNDTDGSLSHGGVPSWPLGQKSSEWQFAVDNQLPQLIGWDLWHNMTYDFLSECAGHSSLVLIASQAREWGESWGLNSHWYILIWSSCLFHWVSTVLVQFKVIMKLQWSCTWSVLKMTDLMCWWMCIWTEAAPGFIF